MLSERFKSDLILLDKALEESQWQQIHYLENKNDNIIDRAQLRKVKMKKGFYSTSTSGSTGEPVTIEKTYQDYLWYIATNIREIKWKSWDTSLSLAIIKPGAEIFDLNSWALPDYIFPTQGSSYVTGYKSIEILQKWLETKNPHYIHCIPSVFKLLDTSRISNFIDWKSTGELGASNFSSEECGTIALKCPSNPEIYHVMENQFVEVDSDNNMIITTKTNPYVKRYKNGDCIELGECNCGRKLQTISKIHGRVRNMFVTKDGQKIWPLIGSREYYTKFGIKKFKAMQETYDSIKLQIICDNLGDREAELKNHLIKCLGFPVQVNLEYVESFPNYKHEEFVCLI